MGQNYDGALVSRLAVLMGRLYEVSPGEEGIQDLVLKLGAQDNEGAIWRRGLASGLWKALQDTPSGTRALLAALSKKLNEHDRVGLWHEIVLAAFTKEVPDRSFLALDGLLYMLRGGEQAQLLQRLILDVARREVPQPRVLDYLDTRWEALKSSMHVAHLKPLILAALLLGEGGTQTQTVDQAASSLEEALTRPPDDWPDEPLYKLLAVVRRRVYESQEETRRRQEDQRVSDESLLEETRREEERLRQQVRDLHTQLASGREESRLDIRHDMLLAVGETLQVLGEHHGRREDLIQDVEAGLSLALHAGGAELLGKVGEEVPYEPRLHQAKGDLAGGILVLIKAPGLLVRGSTQGDRVLLKAKVVPTEGGS
jgi:hypothetical protein